jgi:hypothetical protein
MSAITPRVDLPGGPVTLAPIEELSARREFVAAQIRQAVAQLQQLSADSDEKAGEAGAILVAQRSGWDTSALQQQLSTLDSLTAQIDQVDSNLALLATRRYPGIGGFLHRLGDRQQRLAAIKERDRLATQAGAQLRVLCRSAPEKTVPDADRVLDMLRNIWARSSGVLQQQEANEAELNQLDDEIRRRREAIGKLGFDALWTAAWLQKNEPPAIDSPVQLKRGEIAWLSAPAGLSRTASQNHWSGSSQGISLPLGHTGIRYRVGSFRGHPVQSTVMRNLDSGTLVLTNQRLVFIGHLRSVVIALGHIVHVEAYSDALGVFEDNRPTPDFFKLSTPQYVLFYLNYALNRLQ